MYDTDMRKPVDSSGVRNNEPDEVTFGDTQK